MICKPIGNPLRPDPQGIEIAGKPSAFMTRVKRVTEVRTSSITPQISTVVCPIRGHLIPWIQTGEWIDIDAQLD